MPTKESLKLLNNYMTRSKNEKIWRNNFAVGNTHYQMATPNLADMITYAHPVFKNILHEIVWVQKGDNNIASYTPISQLRALIDKVISTIKVDPKLINTIHQAAIRMCTEYFSYSRKLLELDLEKLNKKELIRIYQNLSYHQQANHGLSVATTWFVDSDGEDLSKLLLARVKNLVAGSKYEVSDVFSVLTTPDKPSLSIKEELESLKILQLIKADRNAKKVFLSDDVSKIERELVNLSPELRKKILTHFAKWRWTPFTYVGPAYELNYYLAVWAGLLKEKNDIKQKIIELENYTKTVVSRKVKIIKDLKINKTDQALFNIATEIIFLKAYRKDALFYGMYVLDKLLREIARRLQLSLQQVRFMAFWEVPKAISQNHFSEKILNERHNFSVYYQKNTKEVIYIGQKAKQFLAGLKIEKIVAKNISTISGTVACPGKAKGRIKIINIPGEMGKMNKGDVMVAHTTYPALVPAMKKAAAMITDDGGITCHAAIVSRELRIPCIVGTKTATKALRDGDLVEVDAASGVIRIIKNK
jgi:phosphohistidine swiveling domain-containing protein